VSELRLRALTGVPAIAPGDDLAAALADAARAGGVALRGGALVVCQKVVSKQEGRLARLAEVEPSAEAARIGREDGKDARQVELVLRETRRVVRRGHGVLICETHHGFVCANAGVDLSNAPAEGVAVLLPLDPDASARRLRAELLARGAGEPLAVIVSDTFGRPWREGLVDVAIGCAGLRPLEDWRGRRDLRGRELAVTVNAAADQLAAAAGLLMAKDAGIPAVWIEGPLPFGEGSARDLLRPPATDLFR
jgi:coenzyme F420-0:L-glutamate ligase/coenzyme F420-1:gamma-L-glutamate ligase